MIRMFLLFFSILFISLQVKAQSNLDSLKQLVEKTSGEEQYNTVTQIYSEYKKSNPDSAVSYAYRSLDIAKSLSDSAKIGSSLNYVGSYYQGKGEYDTCRYYYNKALAIFEDTRNEKGKAMSLSNLGIVSRKLGNFDEALDLQLKSLKIREKISDSLGLANNLHNIGGIYYYMNDYDKAIDYFTNAKTYNLLLGKELEAAKTDNNLGSAFMETGEIDSALNHYQQALAYFRDRGYEIYSAIIQDNIGSIYGKIGKYDEALRYHMSTLEIHQKNNNDERLGHTYNNIGVLYMKMGREKEAENHLLKGLQLANEINNKELEYELLHSLYENAYVNGKHEKALDYFIEHAAIKDSILNEKTHQQIIEMETKYETEKKEQQIELQKSQLLQQEAEIKQEQTQKYLFATASLSILLLSIVLARRYAEKQKTSKVLAAKNKSITESITYAQKIQSAVLPPEDLINNMLPEHFILYMPRDIVSGDFYWITRIKNQTVIAVADCTGHGVPGAFMSMLGFTLLNEVVNGMKLLQANIILNELRDKVKTSLRQKGDEHEAQDGIDIALCIIDQQNHSIQFAGANNPLIIISDGEFKRIKPDRMPVGIQINEKMSFTNHKVEVKKDDVIYMFSDGYIDQFGGENGSRFKASNFEKLLKDIYKKPMADQHQTLENKLLAWKNGYDQIDDILVMGIRI